MEVDIVEANLKSSKSPTPCNKEVESIMITNEIETEEDHWIESDGTYLYSTDREILYDDSRWLNDSHIMCAQLLLRRKFPELTGLSPTILQEVGPLKPFRRDSKSLQILHIIIG